MILCDTSIIVGAINSKDKHHSRCVELLKNLRQHPVTTEACVAEAFHLIRNFAGWTGQQILLDWIESELIVVHSPRQDQHKRECALMRRYADTPMDFADATLVATAENLGVRRILTFDKHFYAYRIMTSTILTSLRKPFCL